MENKENRKEKIEVANAFLTLEEILGWEENIVYKDMDDVEYKIEEGILYTYDTSRGSGRWVGLEYAISDDFLNELREAEEAYPINPTDIAVKR